MQNRDPQHPREYLDALDRKRTDVRPLGSWKTIKAAKKSKSTKSPSKRRTKRSTKKTVAKAAKLVSTEKTSYTEKLQSTVNYWEPILNAIADDCKRTYQLRTGASTADTWFFRWDDHLVRQKTFQQLIGLKQPKRLNEFIARLTFQPHMTEQEAVIAAARLLVRLTDSKRGAFMNLRSWFGRAKDDLGWFDGVSLLSRTDFDSLGTVNLEHLLWVFDSYYDFALRFAKLPGSTIVSMGKSRESGASFGKQCFQMLPFSTWLRYSYLQSLHPKAVLTLLWTKEREFCERKGYIPEVRPDVLMRHLPSITGEEARRIPRYDEQHLVDWQYAFGLPGDVKLPEKLHFGWDFTKVPKKDMHPIGVSEGGQVIYRNARGEVVSEGHPLQKHPTVRGWGSRALIVWMTRENYAELLPYWNYPPEKCPWHWYERFGNGIYKADGTAVHPDARLRPPVTWLEQVGAA